MKEALVPETWCGKIAVGGMGEATVGLRDGIYKKRAQSLTGISAYKIE